jgi:hypothetical protein
MIMMLMMINSLDADETSDKERVTILMFRTLLSPGVEAQQGLRQKAQKQHAPLPGLRTQRNMTPTKHVAVATSKQTVSPQERTRVWHSPAVCAQQRLCQEAHQQHAPLGRIAPQTRAVTTNKPMFQPSTASNTCGIHL